MSESWKDFVYNMKLSPAMQARIAAGELNQAEVTRNTAKLFFVLAGITSTSGLKYTMRDLPAFTRHLSTYREVIDLEATYADLTLLMFSVNRPAPHVAEILLDAGSDPNHGTANGLPLFLAMHAPAMLQQLLDHGANPITQNAKGLSLIDYEIKARCFPAAMVLLEAGADFSVPVAASNNFASENWTRFDKATAGAFDGGDTTAAGLVKRFIHFFRSPWGEDMRSDKDFMQNHFWFAQEIDRRLDAAQERWAAFEAAPDVTMLSHQDLMGFATIGKIETVFAEPYWRGHETDARHALHSLPIWLANAVMVRHPWLTSDTPTYQISDAELLERTLKAGVGR